MTRTVVMFSRPGCCLCDEAREILLRARRQYGFTLLERDIDQDDELQLAYLERIPVIEIDGVGVFEFFVDEAELQRRLTDPPAIEPPSVEWRTG